MEEITKTVHFSVDFEHLTEIAQEEWRSFNLDWALDCLYSCGLDREQANLVLSGKAKMIQAPDGIEGVDGTLAEDDDSRCTDPNYWKYKHIVDPYTYQVGTSNILRQGLETIQKVRYEIIYVINCYHQELRSIEKRRMARQLYEKYPSKSTWKDCEIPFCIDTHRTSKFGFHGEHYWINEELVKDFVIENFYYPDAKFHRHDSNTKHRPELRHEQGLTSVYVEEEKSIPLGMASMTGNVDAYLKRERQLEALGLPEPADPKDSVNGYITPDGKYYPCEWMEHRWLAPIIVDELGVAEERLVKCAQSQLNPGLIGVDPPLDSRYPTDEQLLTVARWCIAHDVKMPSWARVSDL